MVWFSRKYFQNLSWNPAELGVPIVVQWKRIRLGTMRFQVRSLALPSGIRVRRCHELWCRSQTRFGSGVACGSGEGQWLQLWLDPLAWAPPYVAGVALKRQKKKTTAELIVYFQDIWLYFTSVHNPSISPNHVFPLMRNKRSSLKAMKVTSF